MEKYKINGKSITMPTGWHDVKYKDAIHILESDLNMVQIFSLFTGITEDEVKSMKGDKEISYFLEGFPFLKRLPVQDTPQIPRSIKYKGSRYFFPHVFFEDQFDFGETTVGQIEDMKAIIQKMSKEFLGDEERDLNYVEVMKIYPYIVAIYIQPIIEKEYNYKRAIKMSGEIPLELSFKEVVYMGNFFLLKLGDSMTGLRKGSRRLNWMKKKLKQAYRILATRLGFMQR